MIETAMQISQFLSQQKQNYRQIFLQNTQNFLGVQKYKFCK
jgi:hypothetical protein